MINFIWPGTFDKEKARFRKYREVSVDGCERIGWGTKGEIFHYNDELIIKVFNQNNTYRDVEKEITQSRKAFVLGIPTAISFGIVSVNECYGAMYELIDSETVSECIARDPTQAENYAKITAQLANTIHSVKVTKDDGFPPVTERLGNYVKGGIAKEDEGLAEKCLKLINELSDHGNLVHGDFHTGNIFLQDGEPLLIDMDRLSVGHPIAEISDLYYFYVVLGEDDPAVIEDYMGFSYRTAKAFFDYFLRYYLGTEDESILKEVKDKASLLGYIRMVNKIHKKSEHSDKDKAMIRYYVKKTEDLCKRLDTLIF